jgi:hypothetical protein
MPHVESQSLVPSRWRAVFFPENSVLIFIKYESIL